MGSYWQPWDSRQGVDIRKIPRLPSGGLRHWTPQKYCSQQTCKIRIICDMKQRQSCGCTRCDKLVKCLMGGAGPKIKTLIEVIGWVQVDLRDREGYYHESCLCGPLCKAKTVKRRMPATPEDDSIRTYGALTKPEEETSNWIWHKDNVSSANGAGRDSRSNPGYVHMAVTTNNTNWRPLRGQLNARVNLACCCCC